MHNVCLSLVRIACWDRIQRATSGFYAGGVRGKRSSEDKFGFGYGKSLCVAQYMILVEFYPEIDPSCSRHVVTDKRLFYYYF